MTTPREQLAKTLFIADNYFAPREDMEADWENPEHDYLRARYYQHADITIKLGWTPPPPATINATTEN